MLNWCHRLEWLVPRCAQTHRGRWVKLYWFDDRWKGFVLVYTTYSMGRIASATKSIKIWFVGELPKRLTFNAFASAFIENCKLFSETIEGITRLRTDITFLGKMKNHKSAKLSITATAKVENVTTDLLADNEFGLFIPDGCYEKLSKILELICRRRSKLEPLPGQCRRLRQWWLWVKFDFSLHRYFNGQHSVH